MRMRRVLGAVKVLGGWMDVWSSLRPRDDILYTCNWIHNMSIGVLECATHITDYSSTTPFFFLPTRERAVSCALRQSAILQWYTEKICVVLCLYTIAAYTNSFAVSFLVIALCTMLGFQLHLTIQKLADACTEGTFCYCSQLPCSVPLAVYLT